MGRLVQIENSLRGLLRRAAPLHGTVLKPYLTDTETMFRARNLALIIYTGIGILSVLMILFAFETSGYLDPVAKLVFTPFFLGIGLSFAYCLKLLADGSFNVARAIVMYFAAFTVLGAILVTGGFPGSVASIAIFIPMVIGYCLYGGRVSHMVSFALMAALLVQWFVFANFQPGMPNFISASDHNFNKAVATTATILIACTALALFDESNRKFIQRANAASDSKTNFLANTSHEIRTPMNGIIGMTEVMLRTTKLDQDQKVYLDAIHHSGSALMTIINDILDYSSLEGGHVELNQAPFDLYELTHELETLMTITAAQNNVVLSCHYAADLPRKFVGDAGRIRQVMMNLIANAIKFTRDGAVKIIISGTSQGMASNIRIDIEDNGIGIPMDKIGSIFERFNQADSGTTQKYGGTGLGLSISQKLVGLMGGTIGATSKLGEGSVFSVSLPLQHMIAASHQITQHQAANDEKRVLLVTQNQSFVEDYANALRGAGVRVFHTGELSHIGPWLKDDVNQHVPALLMDMSLPVKTRFAVHKLIQDAEAPWRIIGIVSKSFESGIAATKTCVDCINSPEHLLKCLGLEVQAIPDMPARRTAK